LGALLAVFYPCLALENDNMTQEYTGPMDQEKMLERIHAPKLRKPRRPLPKRVPSLP
jgi:hypothetical protein